MYCFYYTFKKFLKVYFSAFLFFSYYFYSLLGFSMLLHFELFYHAIIRPSLSLQVINSQLIFLGDRNEKN